MTLDIIIADDHAIVASGVRSVLERDLGNRIVAEAVSSEQLLALLENTACDLLVTDFNMPGGTAVDGLGLLQLLARRWPALPVVVLTQVNNPGVYLSVLQLPSVLGLVHKSDAIPEIAQAVATAARGRRYSSRFVKRQLEEAETDAQAAPVALSKREAEVMRLFALGKSVSEIAALLNRSVKTISKQKIDAMRKLGVTTDLEFYAYARDHGLVS